MRERPTLFNGDMVRAILEGRKTVTRRLVPAWQLPTELSREEDDKLRWMSVAQRDPRWGFGVFGRTEAECMAQYNEDGPRCCPFGQPGDRLWVRETTEAFTSPCGAVELSRYSADGAPVLHPDLEGCEFSNAIAHWTYSRSTRPSIHMPRWACRILLEVTAVRVERLHDITLGEICKEGLARSIYEFAPVQRGFDAFADLWKSTGGDWDANPWVWVIEFKRLESAHA